MKRKLKSYIFDINHSPEKIQVEHWIPAKQFQVAEEHFSKDTRKKSDLFEINQSKHHQK